MIKEPNAWPDFSMELAELASIQGRFQGFKSIHVPQTRNKTACALAETAKLSIGVYVLLVICSGLDSQTTSSLSDKIAV
ncbi:hypothetical protein F2Q70_00016662 [Brassica cretica]|uniref:RNase H type-1 domain-containing protein n=1 Tax=Brassica cretica TaxID=69181 RepID=A0A8S9I565_BRACR|nr:hypothetical protein F2Q70_00016662 [Brassica cretica]KAF2600233.1 hypothetical protein F2Q68_00009634 [Brassica cretica]